MPKVFAIVVTFNGKKWYDRCFGSLRDSGVPIEIVVIDNSSSDNTVEYIREYFPFIYLIESKENLGFAKANNIGIRYAIDHGAEYVLLLNQDAWVGKDTMAQLLRTFADNENVGVASPVHLNGNATEIDFAFGKCLPSTCISDLFFHKDVKYYDVSFVNAAAWLLSAHCLKRIGGFDTLLFKHYGEDNNYCQRLLYHGYRLVVNMHCSVCHDRDFRKDKIGRSPIWDYNNRRIELRLGLGNINKHINIDSLISKARCKKFFYSCFFRVSKVRECNDTISDYYLIKQSREINTKEGMNWL